MSEQSGFTGLSKETATIEAIARPQGSSYTGWLAKVGVPLNERNVAKIVAYDENGPMSHVPWLAVLDDEGHTIMRCSATDIEVYYEAPKAALDARDDAMERMEGREDG